MNTFTKIRIYWDKFSYYPYGYHVALAAAISMLLVAARGFVFFQQWQEVQVQQARLSDLKADVERQQILAEAIKKAVRAQQGLDQV